MFKALLIFAIIGLMGVFMSKYSIVDTDEKESEEEDSE